MKSLMLFFLLSTYTFFGLQAQQNGIPLKKARISSKLKAKINATPVAKVVGNKRFKMNTRSLNAKMPNGARITSMKVHFTRNKNKPFLARQFKNGKGTTTGYLPLVRRGDEMFIDLSSGYSNTDCSDMPCEDCVSNIIGSGTVVCECSEGGCDTDVSDNIDQLTRILDKLFN